MLVYFESEMNDSCDDLQFSESDVNSVTAVMDWINGLLEWFKLVTWEFLTDSQYLNCNHFVFRIVFF